MPAKAPHSGHAWRPHLVLGALCVAGLTGSGGCHRGAAADETVFGEQAPRHPNNEIWLGVPGEPSTLDPARCNESACGRLVENLFAGLVAFKNDALELEGDLASSWHVSGDARRFRFTLRETRWSDGRPVVADDVVRSVLRVLAPKTASQSAHLLYLLEHAQAFHEGTAQAEDVGVHALNAREVEFRLREPTPYFLQLAAHSVLRPIPAHVPAQSGEPLLWPRPHQLVVSGAYRVSGWRFRRDADFVRNDAYWRAATTPTERVRAVFLPNADAAMSLYEYGALDLLGTHVPVAWQPRVRRTRDVHTAPMLSTNYYWLNTKHPPLDDVRVRRALSLAIDRRLLVDGVLRGQGMPATTLVPERLLRGQAAAGFDPNEARRLLAEAKKDGVSLSRTLSLSFNADETHRRMAEAIQAMVKEHLGLYLELRQQEWRVYLRDLDSREFDVARLGWIADYADAHSFLAGVFGDEGNNLSGWHDPTFLEELRAVETEPDATRREARLVRAQARMLSAQPLIPLSFGVDVTLIKPYIRGYLDNPLGHVDWHRLSVANTP